MNKIIKIDNIKGMVYELDEWKPQQTKQVKKYFTEKFKEIQSKYDSLIDDLNLNKIIFQSEMMFTPIIGKMYYLYENKNGKKFMSIISPEEWNNRDLIYLGCFKQDSRQKWNRIESVD